MSTEITKNQMKKIEKEMHSAIKETCKVGDLVWLPTMTKESWSVLEIGGDQKLLKQYSNIGMQKKKTQPFYAPQRPKYAPKYGLQPKYTWQQKDIGIIDRHGQIKTYEVVENTNDFDYGRQSSTFDEYRINYGIQPLPNIEHDYYSYTQYNYEPPKKTTINYDVYNSKSFIIEGYASLQQVMNFKSSSKDKMIIEQENLWSKSEYEELIGYTDYYHFNRPLTGIVVDEFNFHFKSKKGEEATLENVPHVVKILIKDKLIWIQEKYAFKASE